MAIRKKRDTSRRTSAAADPATKRDPIQGLRFRHAHGRQLLIEFPVGVETGKRWPRRPQYHTGGALELRAVESGITLQELHQRRRFAFLFTDNDLERLCQHETPLSWSTVKWLLRVDDRKERRQLEQRAARNGWTATELKAERRRWKEIFHAGGRPPKLPETFPTGLEAVADAVRRRQLLIGHVLSCENSLSGQRQLSSTQERRQRNRATEAAKAAEAALEFLKRGIENERR